MPTIRQLPPSVVNKIAAGEVIERPASVVKELLENSIDAGATRIDVTVEQGGQRAGSRRRQRLRHRRRATAAGRGQPRHQQDRATPTICFASRTLGFRGEALASIAEVSRLMLRSRTPDVGRRQSAGSRRRRNATDVRPCGCPVGTTIEVRNLFYNTPVRRKFMRTTQTEMGHVERGLHAAGPGPSRRSTSRSRTTAASLYDLPPSERLAGADRGVLRRRPGGRSDRGRQRRATACG